MKTMNLLLTAALAGAMTAGSVAAVQAADKADMEKCYGIAKAGKNDCANANGTHSCAGHATTDNDGGDWVNVKKGECVGMKGSLEPVKAK